MSKLGLKISFSFLLTAFLEGLALVFFQSGNLDFQTQNTWVTLGLGTLVGFLLNSIAFHVLVGLRLHRITEQIRKLVNGETYHKVPTFSNDEIGIFGRFFNEMIRRVEEIASNLRNAERLSDEIGLAAKIQADVLPKQAPVIPGIEMIAKTRSAAEIGGDSFDFIQKTNQTAFYIGDVTGHGVPAGLIMMMVNILMCAFTPMYKQTNDILTKINEIIQPRIASNMFMTAMMFRWEHEKQQLFYTGCGHEHYLHYHAQTGTCDAVKGGGVALGMIPDISNLIQERQIDFAEGDYIVLYSDGITEAKNQSGEMFGIERLRATIEEFGARTSAESVFDNITHTFGEFVGSYQNQKDDITLIVLKNRGPQFTTDAVRLTINAPIRLSLEGGANWTW